MRIPLRIQLPLQIAVMKLLILLGKPFLNDGDYFLIQPPTYEIFKSQCEINRGKAIEVPLLKENFKSDIKNVIKVLKNSTH